VTLENGETLYADLIVGADGQRSLARDIVLSKPLEEEPADQLCLTFSIPTELMQADEDLRHLTEISDVSDKFSDDRSFTDVIKQYSGRFGLGTAIYFTEVLW